MRSLLTLPPPPPQNLERAPKLYSFRKLDGDEDKKRKGIKKCVVKKTLSFEDYKNCLLANSGDVYRSQLMFRSTKHEVHTIEVNKITFTQR